MFDSIFLIDSGAVATGGTAGKVIIEKHYRSFDSRSTVAIIDLFWAHVTKSLNTSAASAGIPTAPSPHVIPIQAAENSYMVHILRDSIYFLAVTSEEVDPLTVMEFLHKMADLFVSYFGGLSELILKDNFAIVYELLEELLDYGQPYITEPNILKDMIPPPSLYSSVMNAVSIGTSFGTKTPTGALSQVPWRTAGIKYNQNEIFFDVNETIDVTVDRYGSIVTGNIHGEIICGSKLSGMPELTLGFSNSRLFEDAMVSFHPCVRQLRFDRDRVLSFIPPDGDFKVMSYTLSLNNLAHAQNLPVVIKPSLQLTKSGGRLTVTLQPRSTGGKPIEAITISLTLPAYVSSAKLNASAGSIQFDQIGKVLKWTIPKLNPDAALPQLSGTLYLESGFNPSDQPPPLIGVKFDGKVNMFTASGLRIDALQVLNEPYKPYKGVRSLTKAGNYVVRL